MVHPTPQRETPERSGDEMAARQASEKGKRVRGQWRIPDLLAEAFAHACDLLAADRWLREAFAGHVDHLIAGTEVQSRRRPGPISPLRAAGKTNRPYRGYDVDVVLTDHDGSLLRQLGGHLPHRVHQVTPGIAAGDPGRIARADGRLGAAVLQ
jgi:hypothetical protein